MPLTLVLVLIAVLIMVVVRYLKVYGLPGKDAPTAVMGLAVIAAVVVSYIYGLSFETVLATLAAALSSSVLRETLVKFGFDI